MKNLCKGNLRILILGFTGIVMMIFSYLIHHFDPKTVLAKKAALISPNSIILKYFKNPPYQILLKVYIFNITNADEFLAGNEKLYFEEVGPYVFQEILQNTELEFNENGTLTYKPRRKLMFLPELSKNDPKQDVVIIPNVPLLTDGTFLWIMTPSQRTLIFITTWNHRIPPKHFMQIIDRPNIFLGSKQTLGIASMLHKSSIFLNLALRSLVNYLDSQPILNLTVHDYFWGYEDTLIETAGTILPNWIDFKRFGILDRMFDERNNTVNIIVDPNRMGEGSPLIDEDERGRLYSISSWNGLSGLEQWGFKQPQGNETIQSNEKCNILEGAYDGSVFPHDLKKDWTFRIYRKLFCRTVPIYYNHTGYTKDGFEAYYFKVASNFLDTYEENPINECYCRDKDYCLPKGFGDLSPCTYGLPTAVSRPHMMDADPAVIEKIGGLKPDKEKHDSFMAINPTVGLLLEGKSRMQTNLVMHTTKYISRTTIFNNMIIPVFWSEMGIEGLPESIRFLLNILFNVLPPLQVTIMYVLALSGGFCLALGGYNILYTDPNRTERSPSLINYSPVRIIPVIRRESVITEMKEWNHR